MNHYTKPNFVYFVRPIGQEGPIKIGCSAHPIGRLETLITWAPVPLEIAAIVPGNLSLERRIHGYFAELHSHREWFRCAPRLTEFVAALAAGARIDTLLDMSAAVLPFRPARRIKRTEDERRRISYAARVRSAYARLRDANLDAKYSPADVDLILSRWSGCGGKVPAPPAPPTSAELERLEEVIRNPAAHARTSEQLLGRFRRPLTPQPDHEAHPERAKAS